MSRKSDSEPRITIRNIDPAAIRKIDALAFQKKMSRNSYLKMQIESMAVLPELAALDAKYNDLVSSSLEAIRALSAQLERTNALVAALTERCGFQ